MKKGLAATRPSLGTLDMVAVVQLAEHSIGNREMTGS
jgi:hypothetical protein